MQKPVLFLLAVLLPLAGINAQKGLVTVVHGIPDLPKAVEVFANGGKLFSFDFGDSKGPIELDPDTYKLEVKLDGNTVLSANAKVEANKNYTVVAHLKETSGIALSIFENDTSGLSVRKSRLYVRHLADAPAVDVLAKRWWRTTTLFRDVMNGQEGSVDINPGTYAVSLNAAGTRTRAFGPAKLSLDRNTVYAVHAIGALGKSSFQLFVQEIAVPVATPSLTSKIRGKACGGSIEISTKAPEFDKPFDVVLKGGTPNGFGFLHTGTSDSRFLIFRLPLELRSFGAPGCFLYQNTPWIRAVALDANGEAKVTNEIPSSYRSSFREIHYQFSFGAPGKNRLGLLLTDYASVERQ